MKTRNNIVTIALLVVVAVIIFWKTSEGVENCDDIQYGYIIESEGETTAETLTRPISTISDIFESQYNHYFTCNGRALVHIAEQFFVGLVPPILFYLCNTAMFLLAIAMFVKLSSANGWRSGPWMWLVAVIAMLYVVEYTNLWYHPAFSINYLWTSAITMAFIVIWQAKRNCSFVWTLPFAFVAGWQHEMFGIAVAGAMVIYYVVVRGNVSWRKILLGATYILGTMMVVLAPGSSGRLRNMGGTSNYALLIVGVLVAASIALGVLWLLMLRGKKGKLARLSMATIFGLALLVVVATHWTQTVTVVPKLWGKIVSRLEYMNELLMLKVVAVTAVIGLVVTRRRTVESLKANLFLVLCLACSAAFVLSMKLGGRAIVGLNLFSAILTVRIVGDLWQKKVTQGLQIACFAVVAVGVIVHQGFVISAMSQYKQGYERVMRDYQKSIDGIVLKDIEVGPKAFTRYVNDIIVCVDDTTDVASWSRDMFALKYGNKGIGIIPLDSVDYKAARGDSLYYVTRNENPNDRRLYTTADSKYYWTKGDSATKFLTGLKLIQDTLYVAHKNFELYRIGGTSRHVAVIHAAHGDVVLVTK